MVVHWVRATDGTQGLYGQGAAVPFLTVRGTAHEGTQRDCL
jgi:hypothetical protein